MESFLTKHAASVIGVLSGFDRLIFRGTILRLAYREGMMKHLWSRQVLLKNFGAWAQALTERVKAASVRVAEVAGRPVRYLASSVVRKDEVARRIAAQDGIKEGLVCVLTCVEPCRGYDIYRNRETKRLELVLRPRKCLHVYHYAIHREVGFLHTRLQTWLPFNIQVGLNGREWLSRQMDRAGLDYVRRENCFVRLEDPQRCQALADRQLGTSWRTLLDKIARRVHPVHREVFPEGRYDYYWSVHQSEWATDVLFKSPQALAELYPRWLRHGISTFASPNVMRFLGHWVSAEGRPHGKFSKEIISDLKHRPEGVRIKHQLAGNSIKLYDKQGSVLRVETTINEPYGFKVFRPEKRGSSRKRSWQVLRKGVADIHRRAEVSQKANERYLEALASVDTSAPIGQLAEPLCRPVYSNGHRFRALRPWSAEDAQLLESVARGEFALNGLRNRDLQKLLFTSESKDPAEKKRRSSFVTRRLGLLRAHGVLKKVHGTHRYLLTDHGRVVVTAILAARNVTVARLNAA